ncbi:FAD/NAD(P)-binding protein [Hyphomicrobium sp. MC1]|uniref:FAD/NAD(P)-binding protein n=1 Tax=Hyphomicrobium sp. (strain MC1) TaxID=717785 RepID=UPI000213F823|nr:FAD-dependent oxidoreductase [Hyphomicrobium sp. MC1]CCB63383.1 FAD dependent oxidoreductase [Hyphomicrobium sp. MC1]
MTELGGRSTVAIIGGGFSGAAVAYHLAAHKDLARIVILEPRPLLGSGLAYGSEDPQHRTNVPAAKMSLLPEKETHFLDWIHDTNALADDPDALAGDGFAYPRRFLFGRYVHNQIAPFLASGAIVHIRGLVRSMQRWNSSWIIRTEHGSVQADFVVIATTHPEPRVPEALAGVLPDDSRIIADATTAGALDDLRPDDKILIVGTGLTMADIVASLDNRGHYGKIIAISRHGLRSKGHAPLPVAPYGNFIDPLPLSAIELLRRTRRTIADAEAKGISWHAIIDAVRAQAKFFWPNLSLAERSRIVRHLRPYWDVHRFRIAPQPESIIRRRVEAGALHFIAAEIEKLSSRHDGLEVLLRLSRSDRRLSRIVDSVVLATGPNHGRVLASQPFLAELKAQGYVRPDPLRLGIDCDQHGRALNRNGQVSDGLWIAGPLARAGVGELMGLPQVTEFAAMIAGNIREAARAYALP